MRDSSIDLAKGLAILFVLLGHSILYHPIQMASMYHWCEVLDRVITSFNMPMFFLISGYLFSKTRKSTADLYKGKTLRILVPYLSIMMVEIIIKLIMPSEYFYNKTGGGISSIINTLLYGGDRWFFYTLFIIFLLVIPFREALKKKWLDLGIIVALVIVYFFDFLPDVFCLKKVFYFMVFFLSGYALSEYYLILKKYFLRFWWLIAIVAVLCNVVFILPLANNTFVFRFVLPYTGTAAAMTMAFMLERVDNNKVTEYIKYCGKYSLQFYLFPSGSIARVFVIWVLHLTNPFLILVSMFILQLIILTSLVEVTRRIKWLKIPCGY